MNTEERFKLTDLLIGLNSFVNAAIPFLPASPILDDAQDLISSATGLIDGEKDVFLHQMLNTTIAKIAYASRHLSETENKIEG